jgi:hypothetical protein
MILVLLKQRTCGDTAPPSAVENAIAADSGAGKDTHRGYRGQRVDAGFRRSDCESGQRSGFSIVRSSSTTLGAPIFR